MAGKNHHYIPQFLQRGFAIVGTNRKKIWSFAGRLAPPRQPNSIKSTASKDMFHSVEVDAAITEREDGIAKSLASLGKLEVGAPVPAEQAADILDHLAPRPAHLRQSLELAMHRLIDGVGDLLGDEAAVASLVGLNEAEPTTVFEAHLDEIPLVDLAAQALGLPREVLVRMFFHLGRENFGETFEEVTPVFKDLTSGWKGEAEQVARAGHDKGLAVTSARSARWQFLAALDWSLIAAPAEGAILPDCVAIATIKDGSTRPFMFADTSEIEGVLMPISSVKVLVGVAAASELRADFDFNSAAARASHRFFLAASNAPEIAAYQAIIDEDATTAVVAAVEEALTQHRNANPRVPEGAKSHDADEPALRERDGKLHFELNLVGSALGRKDSSELTEIVKAVVGSFNRTMALDRLHGITIAADYLAAAASLLSEPEPERQPNSGLIGIARPIDIDVDGQQRTHIVLDACIAVGLLSDDRDHSGWAVGVLVHQLAHVGLTQLLMDRFGTDINLGGDDTLEAWLYSWSQGLLEEYLASSISAQIHSSEQTVLERRDMLRDAIKRALADIPAARLQYRLDHDLHRLIVVTMPRLRQILVLAAMLIGRSAGLRGRAIDLGTEFAAEMKEAGLRNWLELYRAGLESMAKELDGWTESRQLLALNVHVERLLWQFGMIPRAGEDGFRIEVPLATDAVALAAIESQLDEQL